MAAPPVRTQLGEEPVEINSVPQAARVRHGDEVSIYVDLPRASPRAWEGRKAAAAKWGRGRGRERFLSILLSCCACFFLYPPRVPAAASAATALDSPGVIG